MNLGIDDFLDFRGFDGSLEGSICYFKKLSLSLLLYNIKKKKTRESKKKISLKFSKFFLFSFYKQMKLSIEIESIGTIAAFGCVYIFLVTLILLFERRWRPFPWGELQQNSNTIESLDAINE